MKRVVVAAVVAEVVVAVEVVVVWELGAELE